MSSNHHPGQERSLSNSMDRCPGQLPATWPWQPRDAWPWEQSHWMIPGLLQTSAFMVLHCINKEADEHYWRPRDGMQHRLTEGSLSGQAPLVSNDQAQEPATVPCSMRSTHMIKGYSYIRSHKTLLHLSRLLEQLTLQHPDDPTSFLGIISFIHINSSLNNLYDVPKCPRDIGLVVKIFPGLICLMALTLPPPTLHHFPKPAIAQQTLTKLCWSQHLLSSTPGNISWIVLPLRCFGPHPVNFLKMFM